MIQRYYYNGITKAVPKGLQKITMIRLPLYYYRQEYSLRYHHQCQYDPCKNISRFACSKEGGILQDTTSSEAANVLNHKSFLKPQKLHIVSPRAIFPWRHSPYSLPRLIPDTDEYFEQGGSIGPSMPCFPQIVQKIMFIQAAGMMNIPLYKIMLGRQMWEEELTYAFRKAFELSVAGILAETYHVPFHQIRKEDGNEISENDESIPFPVDFNYTFDPTQLEKDDTNNNDDQVEEHMDQIPESQYMMESDLRSLYHSAHEQGKGKLRIRLSTEAVSAHIQSMFLVPFLTRDDIKRDPRLQQSFLNIYTSINEQEEREGRKLPYTEIFKNVIAGLENLATRQIDVNSGVMESTVIAQVAIQCREVFSVTDIESNEIIQGDANEKTNYVTHLVRFEMVCRTNADASTNPNGDQFEIGSWQITDWDDLLGGNIWFI